MSCCVEAMLEQKGNILGLLPSTLIEKILLHLETADIINFGQTSSSFREVALSDLFWLRVLEQRWGHLTRPGEWIVDGPRGHFELYNSKLQFPGTYRLGLKLNSGRCRQCHDGLPCPVTSFHCKPSAFMTQVLIPTPQVRPSL